MKVKNKGWLRRQRELGSNEGIKSVVFTDCSQEAERKEKIIGRKRPWQRPWARRDLKYRCSLEGGDIFFSEPELLFLRQKYS